jgi:hypothetical protein
MSLPLPLPLPLYLRHEEKTEHLEIGEDQLKLLIGSVDDLEGALVGESSRNIQLEYDLGGCCTYMYMFCICV